MIRIFALLLMLAISPVHADGYWRSSGAAVGSAVVGGTDTRVLYGCGSPVLLCDDADLTFNGTTLTATGLTVTGNVGIGTPSPSGKLDVKASAATEAGGIRLTSVSDTDPMVIIHETTDDGVISLYSGSTKRILFDSASTRSSYINAGNVGIGTTSPTSGKLVIVAGTATTDVNALSITQTWGNAAVANGVLMTFTDTTSAATAKALSILGGASGTTALFNVPKAGGFGMAAAVVLGTAPTIASGGCTSPTVTNANGTAHFTIDVGTSCSGSQPVVFTLPTATTGWNCYARNVTNGATSAPAQTGAVSTTAVTITNFVRTTGVAGAWTDGDDVVVSCLGG